MNKKILEFRDMKTDVLLQQKAKLTIHMQLYGNELKAVDEELSKRLPEILGVPAPPMQPKASGKEKSKTVDTTPPADIVKPARAVKRKKRSKKR